MRIAEFIEESNRLSTPDEQFGLLKQAAGALGFNHLAYGVLKGEMPEPPIPGAGPAVLLNYPQDWVRHYFDNGYQQIDPVIAYTPILPGPYRWQSLAQWFDLDERQSRLFDESDAAGISHGISVPLHGPLGSVAVVSFASSHGDGDIDIDPNIGRLQALAAQFHVAFTGVAAGYDPGRQSSHLTEREQECLCWVARGKSSWDIGRILGISEFTVNYHLKKTLRKLETHNRIVAVVKAIRLGLIRV